MDIDPRLGLPNEKGIFEEIAKREQKIVISTVSRRYGKITTVVQGFDSGVDIKSVARHLKETLACGGTFKDNVIELQGNHKKNVKLILIKLGFHEESIDNK